MLVEKKHECSLKIGNVVVEHLIIEIQIVDEVSDEEQVISFKRRKVSDALWLFFHFICLYFFVLQSSSRVRLALSARDSRLANYSLVSVVNSNSGPIKSSKSVCS